MIVLDICLSDIPKDKITEARNGKKYCKMCLTEMREADQFGNQHTIYMSQSKEEREAKAAKVYVGKGKDYGEKKQPNVPIANGQRKGDLPF